MLVSGHKSSPTYVLTETLSASFFRHDAEYHLVCYAHAVGSDGSEVVNRLVYAVVYDALG